MSADETLGSPVPAPPENSGSAVMTDESQPADEPTANAESDSSPAGESSSSDSATIETAAAPRKPRLNPSVDPQQFKAVPTLKTLAPAGARPPAAKPAGAPAEGLHAASHSFGRRNPGTYPGSMGPVL